MGRRSRHDQLRLEGGRELGKPQHFRTPNQQQVNECAWPTKGEKSRLSLLRSWEQQRSARPAPFVGGCREKGAVRRGQDDAGMAANFIDCDREQAF
jgi:hypothetical protein